jgi:hypothetical protein
MKLGFVLVLVIPMQIQAQQAERPNLPLKEDETWVCSRWKGSLDPTQKSPTVCLTWTKKDCSQRLYKFICKRGI